MADGSEKLVFGADGLFERSLGGFVIGDVAYDDDVATGRSRPKAVANQAAPPRACRRRYPTPDLA